MVTKKDIFQDFTFGLYDTARIRADKPLVVFVWRPECPICRMALPYFDRLQSIYPDAVILGVFQGTSDKLREFVEKNGIRFPQVTDEDLKITRSLDLDIVPSYWLLGYDLHPIIDGVGWDKGKLNEIGGLIASRLGIPASDVVTDADDVVDFRPG